MLFRSVRFKVSATRSSGPPWPWNSPPGPWGPCSGSAQAEPAAAIALIAINVSKFCFIFLIWFGVRMPISAPIVMVVTDKEGDRLQEIYRAP